jgi:hypothetical protein
MNLRTLALRWAGLTPVINIFQLRKTPVRNGVIFSSTQHILATDTEMIPLQGAVSIGKFSDKKKQSGPFCLVRRARPAM